MLEKVFALSENQKGLYFDCQIEDVSHYNLSTAIVINEELNLLLFEEALTNMVRKHSVLRTCFITKDDLPVQVILPEVEFTLHYEDISGLSAIDQGRVTKELALRNAMDIFDLEKAPLFRAKILKTKQKEYVFFFCIHHIISDGWSLEILKQELLETYLKLKNGAQIEETPLEKDFFDFVTAENKKLNEGKYRKQKEHWLQKMAGARPLTLLSDYPVGSKNQGSGKEIKFSIGNELYKKLKQVSMDEGTTLFMFLFTVFKVLLYKYTGVRDITITSPFTNRPGLKYEKVMGYFVNQLPIRDIINPEMSFRDFLLDVKRTIVQAYKHVQYPNNLIFRELNANNVLDNSMLDISFVFDIYVPEGELLGRDMNIAELPQEALSVPGTLMMLFLDTEKELLGKIQYNAALFKESTITGIAEHFTHLVEQMINNPETKIASCELITEKEKELILNQFNRTDEAFPEDKTVYELFEARVEERPDQIAVVYNDTSLTYKELNEKVNQLARLLMNKGVKPNTTVGLMAERSLEMVIGIMGILKAGGAYVPIDPEYPMDRIEYILEDSNALVLLTNGSFKDPDWGGETIDLKNEYLYRGDGENTGQASSAGDLAYVIYTSGSTGKPKGVMIEHRGVVNILLALENLYPLPESDAYLLKTTYTFDVSVTELFGWFMGRGRLVVLENGYEKDPEKILATIESKGITHINFVPSMFRAFLNLFENRDQVKRLHNLKYIFVAGEAVTPDVIEKFYALDANIEFVNIYGPTEATIYASYYPLKNFKEGVNVPIGKPLPNMKNYIVGEDNRLQPVSVPGELCLSGAGLARGYANREDLTGEKFVPNPFAPDREGSFYGKMYRTGDLARWLPDGNIEYLGRIDFQVKIRGFRIELGEIETVLLDNHKINDAVVVAQDDQDGNKFLCAYFTSKEEVTSSELRDYLAKSLPLYMLPAYFVRLEQMPLTGSGKTDRKGLPEPKEFNRQVDAAFIAPRTQVEKTIAGIWKQVLNVDNVGVDDNFFDLGGHSLSLIQVHNKLKTAFHKEIPMVKFFQYPTIKSLVSFIESPDEDALDSKNACVSKKACVDEAEDEGAGNDIAVIGMAGRFPGAKNINEFWRNLRDGVESIRTFTGDELKEAGIAEEEFSHPNYVKAKGVLEDIEYFDPVVFDYSPKEVEVMDPQLRVLYQCAHEALEHAGYNSDTYQGLIGFFAGNSDNYQWTARFLLNDSDLGDQYQIFTLNANNFLSTRVSYKLNLKGPSYTAQTGCSTSLVTIHLACQSLLYKECDMALAGGVTVELPKTRGYLYQEGMLFSPDGHCRPFDEQAKGTVFSDGAGIVVLKRLKDALRDGDHIHAIVKASAINNDGRTKVAYTAPSIEGQSAAIKAAYRRAGLSPETIGYIEAHGTGTSLGDPIEVEALKLAFDTPKKQFCRIGSVKGNIGHLDIAAGVAGFIKTVLCLENRELPPSINFAQPNPKIDLINSPFVVHTRPAKWENGESPLRAGINSFGVGGTNAHVVLEEAPQPAPSSPGREWKLLVLSANTEPALDRAVANLADYLRGNNDVNLSDVAYTLQLGRKAYKYKKIAVCKTVDDAIALLSSSGSPALRTYVTKDGTRPVFFMFSGQWSNYVNTAKELYANENGYKQIVDQCFNLLGHDLKEKVKSACYPPGEMSVSANGALAGPAVTGEALDDRELVNQDEITGLAAFIIEYALAKLLIKWGIRPTAMIGHDVGEYVAACIAGVFSLQDALHMVRKRGELLRKHPDLASGVIYYSTERVLDSFEDELKKIALRSPAMPYISSISGKWITNEEATDPQYWAIHLACIFNLEAGLGELLKEENACFIEVGAGKELTGLAARHKDRTQGQVFLNLLNPPKARISGQHYLYKKVGRLWCAGVYINWERFYEGERRHRIPLPSYSFDQNYFPVDTIDFKQILGGNVPALSAGQPVRLHPGAAAGENYVRTRSEMEKEIAGAFESVLGINGIGIHEDFFELGGDSLKAVSLGSEIHKRLNVKIDLTELFQRPTAAQLAGLISDHAEQTMYSSIEPVEKRAYYPLSSAQKRMYALYQLDERSLAYNLPSATIIEGAVDIDRFREAFKKLVRRHESLRTSFAIIDGEPVQVIHEHVEPDIKYREVTITDDGEIDDLARQFVKPYNLAKPPLFRIEVVKTGENRHVLLFDVHHIIADGTSAELLTRDGCRLYFGDLPGLRIQYKDFAVWQNRLLQSDRIKKQKEYWINRFRGEIPILNMPADYPRPTVKSFAGDRIYFEIDEELTRGIKGLAAQNGATLYITLLAAYNVLLYKYTGQNDVIVGSPSAGRRHHDLENVVGMFINTLAMRNFPAGSKTFQEFLLEVKKNSLAAFENQDYQFDDLVDHLDLNRDISRNPLFDTEFDLQNMEFHAMAMENLKFIPYQITNNTSQFDLALECQEQNNRITAILEYYKKIFSGETARRLANHYLALLRILVDNPEIKLADININTAEDTRLLIHDFNATKRRYESDQTLPELFEEAVVRDQSHPAVIFGDRVLTNRELNEKANQLARLLRSKGVGKDTIVGLYFRRSCEMIIGMMGVLKAGGAYLPLDPDFPEVRLNYMVQDSETGIILSQQELRSGLDFPGEIICLDDNSIYRGDNTDLACVNDADDLAYVIYTSGSTGNPKGVMISHRNVHNFILGVTDEIDFSKDQKIISVTTFSFDIFVLESLLPLVFGVTTVIAGEDEQKDPRKLNELICRHRISMLQTTPSLMKGLVEDDGCNKGLNTLGWIMLGGEEFPLRLLQQLKQKTGARIYNMYGPTETTVWSSIQELTARKNITIGRPIANTQIYILNENNQPQPMGVLGEICIAGDGVARGYLKRPKLTGEKFIPNPFIPGTRLYKTGDLGRWLPGGELEVKGRMDFQVKIRGYRIELGEIEHLLLNHLDVKAACVVKKTNKNGADYLCAYYVAEGNSDYAGPLRDYLSRKLPPYMIPSYFVKVAGMPLTPNGKIDRKLLPEPDKLMTSEKTTFVAPKTNLEKAIASVWQEVLGVDKVGMTDNFFDIGGHSLGLIQVTGKLRNMVDKDIPFVAMFQYPTVESLARFFEAEEIGFRPGFAARPKKAQTGGDIAVIGIAGRFPGAGTVEEYWDMLKNGRETITFFTDAELSASGIDESMLRDPDYVRAKGVLAETEYFDAAFFDYSPKEADMMDPQLRLLHECSWEALERSGYNPDTYAGPIGFFAGSASNMAWLTRFLAYGNNLAEAYEAGTLNEKDFLSTRVSYKLNLKGPSFTAQTACSTSLVTIHLACQSLLKGECDMALAGGVALSLPRKEGYLYQEGMIFSKDGRCRPFDEKADGTVFGEGIGMVVLKRLEEAIEDGDHIHAVVKGSAINNDGIRKIGFTAPSIEGQAEVVAEACSTAGVDPETISYVETHGTGTSLGDPVEIEALKLAFNTNKKGYCAIGSVKANIGHLDTAAGVAGFIKTVLSLEHKQIPPSINFASPNPKIDFVGSPFFVNTGLINWKNGSHPLRAGVSSFGIGGTNSHVVLEESSTRAELAPGNQWQIIVLSARTTGALDRYTRKLVGFLRQNTDINLADVAYTLQVGRKPFKYRRAVVCSSVSDALEKLSVADLRAGISTVQESSRPVIFMFAGQNPRDTGMVGELYSNVAAFKEEVDACLACLPDGAGAKVQKALFPGGEGKAEHDSNQAETAPAAAFIAEYALAGYLMKLGIKPHAMLGRGVGEYVAACLAGVFSLAYAVNTLAQGVLSTRGEPGPAPGATGLREPVIPFISSATGQWITVEQATDPAYWADGIRSAGQIEKGLSQLLKEENGILIEIGAGGELTALARHHEDKEQNLSFIDFLHHPEEDASYLEDLFDKLGRLWCEGVKVNWNALHGRQRRNRVPLPAYSFEKQYFVSDINLVALQRSLAGGRGMTDAVQSTPLHRRTGTIENYVAPHNEAEEKVTAIFQQTLGIDRIGVKEDFFALGGDSLKALQVAAEIHKAFNVRIEIAAIFNSPTAELLAASIEKAQGSIYASIVPVEEREYYPVSAAQKRMFALYRFEEDTTAYNLPVALIVEGEIDYERFASAWREVIKRHESLRTSFDFVGGEPVQKVHGAGEVRVEIPCRAEIINDDREINLLIQQFIRPFNIKKPPLLRAELVKTGSSRHVLLFDMHHIISDGTSLENLVRELIGAYGGELPPLTLQYKDFAVWQNNLFKSETIWQQKQYWLNRFADEIPVLALPTDFPRPPAQNFAGARLHFVLDEHLTAGLKRLCSENNATLFMTLLSAYTVLLAKYTSQTDIVVGSPTAGRNHSDLKNLIGMFINTLPMRNHPEHDLKFSQFLQAVKQNALEAFENQDYQFDDLVEQLDLRRDLSRNPVFDTMFVLQNVAETALDVEGLKFVPYEAESNTAKFDLSLECREEKNVIRCNFEYCTRLFKPETVERMKNHLLSIIGSVMQNPDLKLGDIGISTSEEERAILVDFNDTRRDYPDHMTLGSLFEEQAARTPGGKAVVYDGESRSYKELDEMANRLARVLQSTGVVNNDIVAIVLDRSLAMPASILGVLKSGGAYLPIDPDAPESRMAAIINEAGPGVIITQKKYRTKIANLIRNEKTVKHVLFVDSHGEATLENEEIQCLDARIIERQASAKLNVTVEPSDMAYVIYTSGSTGTPKGVVVKHGSIANNIYWRRNEYQLDAGDSVLILFPYYFDGFITSFFTPILSGASTVFIKQEEARDAFALKEIIAAHGITHFIVLPSLYYALLECCSPGELNSLRTVTLAGERLTAKVVNKSREINRAIAIYNEYGPTESSVVATCFQVTDSSRLPIGKPVANTQIYITGGNLKLLPVGIPGELCISGKGLAAGYLNRPGLTEERFVPNPFVLGERLYRTGDLAKWLPDGNIEFLGRIDDQVKIRGYRIEPGEIENVILRHGQVKEAFVAAVKEGNLSFLCAYYVPAAELGEIELNRYLAGELPEYMVPACIMKIDQIPLTPTGKVDKNALPKPELHARKEYIPPRSDLEKQLAEIWQEVLGVEKVSINYNFFAIGGDSLKAIAITSKLNNAGLKLRLNELFTHSTIEELAGYIGSVLEEEAEQQVAVAREEYSRFPGLMEIDLETELANIEKRLDHSEALLNRAITSGKTLYQFPASEVQKGHLAREERFTGNVVQINKHLDQAVFAKAFLALVKNQELLRAVLVREHEEPCWRVYAAPDRIPIEFVDLSPYREDVKEQLFQEIVRRAFRKQFNADAVLYRVFVLQWSLFEHYLAIPVDHAIFDGMSIDIIRNKIGQYYDCLCRDGAIPSETSAPYSQYVRQVEEGPQHVTVDEIIQQYELEEYHYHKNIVADRLTANESDRIAVYDYALPFCNAVRPDKTWEIAFYVFTSALAEYLSVPKIPLNLVNFGRRYQDSTYFETVGEFLDIIPLLVTVDDNSFRQTVESIQNKLHYAARHNINFITLAAKDTRINKLVTPPTESKDMLILFNYQGFISEDEQSVLKLFSMRDNEIEHGSKVSSIECDLFFDERQITIRLISTVGGFNEPMQKLIDKIVRTKLDKLQF